MTARHSFSDSFSDAFDRLVPAPPAVHPDQTMTFTATRPPTPTDTAYPLGGLWLDVSNTGGPVPAWQHQAQGVWVLIGRYVVSSALKSSARLWRAALLRTGRWWLITKAPLGVLEGDMGSIYVSRFDSEADSLMRGFRGVGVPTLQTWPTVDDVVTELMNTTAANIDASRMRGLEQALEAAIEWVTEECEGGWL